MSARELTCPTCAAEHDRGINATLNINQQGILKLRSKGIFVSACGGPRKTRTQPAAA